jgi:glutathione S-transferase
MELRVHRVPHSTNVERVALALAHKGAAVTWVDVDPADRSPLVALSGQDLVPVLETPDEVIPDSAAILAWLDARFPDPPLWPADQAERAVTDIAIGWFNRVWKVAPNAIDAELGAAEPDAEAIAALSGAMVATLPWFEALLGGRDFLLGDTLGALDVVAFPFLKFGVLAPAADDPDRFHAVLHEHLPIAGRLPRLEAWVARIDALPRA